MIALCGCVAIAAAGLLGAGCGETGSRAERTGGGQKPVYEISGLYPTYEGVDALLAEADVIVLGRATASKVVEGVSVEDDPDGAPLSGLPMTEYDFFVEQVGKGSAGLAGTTIDVRALGGETAEATYVVETGQPLDINEEYLLFLRAGSDGFYYPLAGDSAVATRNASGDYGLPAGVLGAGEATVPAEAIEWVENPPPPNPPAVAPAAAAVSALPARAPSIKGTSLVVKRGAVKLVLVCQAGSAPCLGRVSISTREAKPRQVASARYAIEPGHTQAVKLRLNRSGKQLLADAPSPRLPVRAQLDPDGETKATIRNLLFRTSS